MFERIHLPLVVARPELGAYKGTPYFGQTKDILVSQENQEETVLQTDVIPGPPQVCTVQLVRVDSFSFAGANAKPVARVQARCGGATIQFDADWVPGNVISVCCDSLTLTARFQIVRDGIAFSTGGTYKLGATFGLGYIAGRVLNTGVGVQLGPATGVTSFAWNVPPYARAVSFNMVRPVDPDGSQPWDDSTITFVQGNGGAAGVVIVNASQLSRVIGTPWNLVPGVITVTARSAVANVIIYPQFELAV